MAQTFPEAFSPPRARAMMAGVTTLARTERLALCDTLERVGPAAPTLCSPWTTADLAAHIVIRDRRPDLAAGIWLSAFASVTERGQAEYAGKPWPELVALLRSGPPIWSPARVGPVDEAVNLAEFYIHHEDVLRAEADGPQREVSDRLESGLWGLMRRLGRVMYRSSATGVVLVAPGYGHTTVHGETAQGTVVLTGRPSELIMASYGRGRQADLDFIGEPDAVEALLGSSLGIA